LVHFKDRGAPWERLACKSVPKACLKTDIDVVNMHREVGIVASHPDHPTLVRLRTTYEDYAAVHIVMDRCDGRELFDRIVAHRV
jgi:calcium-dependent protein kinase